MNKFPFVEKMKQETWQEHEASKDSLFATTIMSGELGKQAFIDWQLALYPIYVLLEDILKLKRKTDPSIHIFDHRKLDRADKIYSDLIALGVDPIKNPSKLSSVPPYLDAIQKASDEAPRLMAYHYTRYMGDMNGGQVIAMRMSQVYDIDKNQMSCYDFSDIGDLYHYRKQYKTLLELVPWTEDQRRSFIDEAKIAYAVNEALFNELYETNK